MSGFAYQASTDDLLEAFTEAVADHGGSVVGAVQNESFLIARALLPPAGTVAPNDPFKSGVAIRADAGEVWVHPYVVREVCSNGAILPRTLEAIELGDVGSWGPSGAAGAIRAAVSSCADVDLFQDNLRRFAATRIAPMDLALSALPGLGSPLVAGMAVAILREFFQGGDRSLYGFVNAITATARDTADPLVRWELEAAAGALATDRAPASLGQAPVEAAGVAP
ncbi:MAG: hypothetical protein AB7L66_00720 [Gemmatimonadales bacterium]